MMINQRNYHNCKLIRQQVDAHLEKMASLFTNIGIDSTVEEIQQAYKRENELIDKIAELDPEKADNLRASY